MKRPLLISLVLFLLIAACSSGTSQATPTQPAPTAIPATPTTPPSATPEPTATPIPPTETPIPPTATPTAIPPTNTPIPSPTVDLEAAMQSANIILFEDMWFSRYVKQALDEAGYNYTDVADRLGSFQEALLSDTKWDLIIAAAEGRGGVAGEFFDYIGDQLDQGASVIMEIWILDWAVGGRIDPILDECGITFQDNWVNPGNRAVFWADPHHPIATTPNEVSLTRFINFWVGDLGDLVALSPGSDATIVGSADDPNPSSDGLITVCYDNRLLLQTFSSHDHSQESMVALWQNYVYFMLSNRFR
jgi:hypothetical protein